MSALQRRAELALFEKTEIEQTSAAGQEDQLELLAEANKIQSEITGIVPEEQYKTTEKDRETVRGKDGKEERRTTRVVTLTTSFGRWPVLCTLASLDCKAQPTKLRRR